LLDNQFLKKKQINDEKGGNDKPRLSNTANPFIIYDFFDQLETVGVEILLRTFYAIL